MLAFLFAQFFCFGGRRVSRRIDRDFLGSFVGSLFELGAGALDGADFSTELGANIEHLTHQIVLLIPPLLELGEPRAFRLERRGRRGMTFFGFEADRSFAIDDFELGFQRLDSPPRVVDVGRHRVLANCDPGTGRIEQTDRLVGKLPGGNVAMRQPDRGFERLVEQLHAVVLFERRGHTPHHQQRALFARLIDLNHLEAAGQRRVFLEVFLVLSPGGGGDRA